MENRYGFYFFFSTLFVAGPRPTHTWFLSGDVGERWVVGNVWLPADSRRFPHRNVRKIHFLSQSLKFARLLGKKIL